ncbi:MAG: hypothetical protein ACI37T_05525, partial [Candidatus Gastranaerophilaceae bacterium]
MTIQLSKISNYIRKSEVFGKIKRYLTTETSFAVNCINSVAKVLLNSAFSEYKKIVLIVDSEQTAIKY